jgi:hypothetical protein
MEKQEEKIVNFYTEPSRIANLANPVRICSTADLMNKTALPPSRRK